MSWHEDVCDIRSICRDSQFIFEENGTSKKVINLREIQFTSLNKLLNLHANEYYLWFSSIDEKPITHNRSFGSSLQIILNFTTMIFTYLRFFSPRNFQCENDNVCLSDYLSHLVWAKPLLMFSHLNSLSLSKQMFNYPVHERIT